MTKVKQQASRKAKETGQNPDTSTSTKKRFYLTIVGLALSAAVVLAGMKILNRTQSTSQAICGPDTIIQYNQFLQDIESTDTTESSFDESFRQIVSPVESTPGYEQNPTCVYIAYQYYAYTQDTTRARQLLDMLKALDQQGSYIDDTILGKQTIEEMETYVRGLEHNQTIGDDADGNG